MGMFDTIFIKKSLLENVIPEEFKPFLEGCSDGYLDFQTKDLDNFLNYYYIEEDLQLYCKRYKYDEECLSEKEKINVTQYITYYDLFETKTERIFLTIKSHVVDGILYGSEIESIERTNLEEEAIRLKQQREQWAKQEAQWEMKLFRFLQTCEWKWHRFTYNLDNRYNKFKTYLSETAKKKASQE
jgi:hypothetical protein